MTTPTERTIEVVVSPKGRTTITSRGYAGTSCRDATRALEQALGVVQSDRPTPELYQAAGLAQRQDERQ